MQRCVQRVVTDSSEHGVGVFCDLEACPDEESVEESVEWSQPAARA